MSAQVPADGNIWIASYPKSGNTWMRLALGVLAAKATTLDIGKPSPLLGSGAADRGVFDRLLDVDSSNLSTEEIYTLLPAMFAASLKDPLHDRFWKTHTAWHLTPDGQPIHPIETTRASLYLVRDPRDVAVSFSHHFNRSLDEAITMMGNPHFCLANPTGRLSKQLPQLLMDWSGNVASWLDQARPVPVVLRYEDMVRDFAPELTRAARACGLPHHPEAIAAAVEATRFKRLHAQEASAGWFSQRNSIRSQFFRRGVAGDWKTTLTPAQAARIEKMHGPIMRRLGYLPG